MIELIHHLKFKCDRFTLTSLLVVTLAIPSFAQTYLKFEQSTGTVAAQTALSNVTQSSGTVATVAQMNDLSFSTGALTASGVNEWVVVDMATARTISYIDIAARSSASYVNARDLQVSTDMITWTTVAANMTGVTTSAVKRFSFTPISARYVRVYNPSATAGIVGVSELIPESISNLIVAPASADGASTVRDIPFIFTFKGTAYTKFSVNANGLMRLGTTAVTTESTNLTRSTTNTPKLFAYWDNLATGTLATNGGVRTWTTGTAPNRIQIIDWKVNNANSTTGAVTMNYQIWIYEGTNKIEYIYGAGTTAAANTASIGMGGTVAATDFISVTALGSPAKISYHNFNDAITNSWPGSGVKYSFTPTTYPTTNTVPGTDFPSFENAIGALNWAGSVPAGGTTINLSSSLSERVPNAITVAPTVPAGVLLKTTGTAANPITINGNGAKLYAGNGGYNWDYVLGLAGTDYVTVDGLNIRDTSLNTTVLLKAEIGIGLFKKQYNTTLGNDGCQYVTVRNNMIRLTREIIAVKTVGNTYGGAGTGEVYWSRGIYLNRWNNTHTSLAGGGRYVPYYSSNLTQGIKSQSDVHNNCSVIGNTIDECSLGIELDDNYLFTTANLFAGQNNIIGAAGAGNTIRNWGPHPSLSLVYTSTSYDNETFMGAIVASGQKNYTVEYNTIDTMISETSTSSDIENFVGILIGESQTHQASPMRGNTNFFAKVNNNAIIGINATKTASNIKSAQGIVFYTGYLGGNNNSASYSLTGNVEIKNNTISNLRAINGKVAGIGTYLLNNNSQYPNSLGTSSNQYNYFYTNGNVVITDNVMKTFRQTPTNVAGSGLGMIGGIQWNIPANNIFVERNTLGGTSTDGFIQGSSSSAFINDHILGMRGILVDMGSSNYTIRSLVSIKKNTITNLDRLAGTITSYTNQDACGASAITLYKGAAVNNIDSNTITGMDVANGLYSAGANESFDVIRAYGQPKSGISTLNVRYNSISSITRNQFGFLTSMSAGSGLNSFTSGIHADYTGAVQHKNIIGNTIDGITQTKSYATTGAQEATFYTQLYGIRIRGKNATNDSLNIYDNKISNLTGDNWNYTGSANSTSAVNYTNCWNVIGINAADYHKLNMYRNRVCGLATNMAGGTATTNSYAHGVVGINFGKSGTGALATATTLGESVYNNFVSELTAPAINSQLAITGINYWGYGRYARLVNNTVAIGNPAGGTTGRLASTGTSFGVSGISFNHYYFNVGTYAAHYNNNIVSINATAKGSTTNTTLSSSTTGGFNTCWRSQRTTAKRSPKGIKSTSGGNIYFINGDFRNFIYSGGSMTTGTRYYTSGIINAYGYFKGAPANYTNVTNNLINDTTTPAFFNATCGKYKSFWGSAERTSFIDINGSNIMQPIPFVNAGATCEDKLKIANGANSYVATAPKRYTNLLDVSNDYFLTARGSNKVTAGAHENNSNITGPVVDVIDFDYEPICNGVCKGNKTITVTIIPPTGKTIDNTAGTKAPRIYYRRVRNNSTIDATNSDANVMVNSTNNTATGTEGWRWVEASSVSGNNYTFTIDESKLKNNLTTTPTYSIEYFVIAMTSDNLVTSWSSGDFSLTTCPTTVDLFTVGGATMVPADDGGDTELDLNSVSDIYTVYKGADVASDIVLQNNGTTYTANMTTAHIMCKGEEVKITGRYYPTATLEPFQEGCITYRFDVADNATFTTNLQKFNSTDSNFTYMMTNAGTKYFRVWLTCGTDSAPATNTPYVFVTANDCPTNTGNQADLHSCVGTAQTITVSTSTPTVSKFFWVVNPYGKIYTNPATAQTALTRAITVNPTDTIEEGTWRTYVTLSTGPTILDQGVKAATYFDGTEYSLSGAAVDTTKGVAFKVNKFMKLNGLSVIGATGDASATTGWNAKLYSSTGKLIYTAAGASAADNAVTSIALTNWNIAPGEYMLILGASTAGTEPTGALGSVAIVEKVNVPNTATPTFEIIGGVSDLDYSNIDSGNVNYFVNWDYTDYCSSPADSFEYIINPASCCAVAPNTPVAALIANGTESPAVQTTFCRNIEAGWYYYFDPATPKNILFAVNPNGNAWNPTEGIVYNTGSSSDSDHYEPNADTTLYAELMPYMLRISNTDSFNLNGGIKIRMFYPAVQKAIIDAYSIKTWFKADDDKVTLLQSLTPTGLPTYTPLTPAVTGVQNSIPFVEFHNVTTVGTFGYFGRACTPPSGTTIIQCE